MKRKFTLFCVIILFHNSLGQKLTAFGSKLKTDAEVTTTKKPVEESIICFFFACIGSCNHLPFVKKRTEKRYLTLVFSLNFINTIFVKNQHHLTQIKKKITVYRVNFLYEYCCQPFMYGRWLYDPTFHYSFKVKFLYFDFLLLIILSEKFF